MADGNDYDPFAEDFYQRLGVDPDADIKQIKAKGYTLINKYHPRNVRASERDEAREKYYNIMEAFETLTDEEEREVYDRKRERGEAGSGPESESGTGDGDGGGDGDEDGDGGKTESGSGRSGRTETEKRTVELDLSVSPETPRAGETVTFTVRENGRATGGAEVRTRAGTKHGTTRYNGRVFSEFREQGRYTVEATKEADPDTTYRKATQTVVVEKPEPVDLSLEVDPRDPSVDDPVQFKVTGNGDDGIEGATVSGDGWTATTDRHGTCRHTFDTSGTKTVTATKPGSTPPYRDATERFRVETGLETVRLDLTAGKSTVAVGDPVTFTVTDSEGNGLDGVKVKARGETVETSDGEVVMSFDEPGSVAVRAEKSNTDEREFSNDTTTVSVERPDLGSLNITPHYDEVHVGETLQFTVRKEGGSFEGVKGATVSVCESSKEATTDGSGRCGLEFDAPGRRTVVATKSIPEGRYEPGRTTVEVKERPDLFLVIEEGRIEEGDWFWVEVRNDDGPVSGAKVETDRGRVKTTGRNGRVEFRFDKPTAVELTAISPDGELESEPKSVRIRPILDLGESHGGTEPVRNPIRSVIGTLDPIEYVVGTLALVASAVMGSIFLLSVHPLLVLLGGGVVVVLLFGILLLAFRVS